VIKNPVSYPFLKAVLLPLAFMLGLSSCAVTTPQPSGVLLPAPEQVLQRLSARRQAVRSFLMQGGIEILAPEGELHGDHLIQGVYPGRLRAEVLGPFGRPLLNLVCDGRRIMVLDFRANKAYVGQASRRNLGRFLGLYLSPPEIFSLLCGNVPLPGDGQAQVLPGPEKDQARLEMEAPGRAGNGSLVFGLKDYQVLQAQLDLEGGLLLSCRFSDYIRMEQGLFPRRLQVKDQDERSITLSNEELAVNLDLDASLFAINLPPGIEVQRLQ
jgi:outer membrane lipoprotein-sorting protein